MKITDIYYRIITIENLHSYFHKNGKVIIFIIKCYHDKDDIRYYQEK